MSERRSVRSIRLIVGVAIAIALGACGGSPRPAAVKPLASASTRSATSGAEDYSNVRSALVAMRQYSPESLMWQTVSVSKTGHGELTTLIGEVSGAERTSFQLPAGQVGLLARLLTNARGASVPAEHDLRATLYTLSVPGRPSMSIQGTVPKPLGPLIHFLAGLMTTYCC